MTTDFDTIIIGGGLSGLTVAHTLRTAAYGHRFAIVDKAPSTGGVIRSHEENGFIAENGPHGFLDNCAESRAILADTGLDKEAVRSPLAHYVRYVQLGGKLRMIPQSPLKIATAPLIPWKAKFRVLAEIWRSPLEGEVTVQEWVKHRFGEALLPFADAVFTGTYAGDIQRLKMDGVMPGLRKLEAQHGSLIRGLVAKASAARKTPGARKKFTMPAMTSFPRGMTRLVERLTEYLEEDVNLFLNCEIDSITRQETGWQLQHDAGNFTCTNLVLALPVNGALPLLSPLTPPPLASIPEAPLATVVCGFGNGSSLPKGFGYLIPESENSFSLGTLFSSNMFPGRAPSGQILFETLIGGRRHPERCQLPDDELIANALNDVRPVLDLKGEPTYLKVLRPWGNIPQLEEGYPELLAWRNRLISSYSGLHVCGFGWEGIGINDMIKTGVKVAHDIRSGERKEKEAAVKGVYF